MEQIDYISHVMAADEIASLVAYELEEGELEYGQSEALRTAAIYCFEIDRSMTSGRFADGCVVLGLHKQAARNRYNETKEFRDLM